MKISVNQRLINVVICLIGLFLFPACAPKLNIGPSSYPDLKLARSVSFHDTLDKEGLERASLRQLTVLDSLLSRSDISKDKRVYYEEMADITKTVLSGIERPDFERFISEKFDLYRAREAGSVLFTGYYTPLLHGSREKSELYQYPVYGLPDDLIFVDLEKFGKSGKVKGVVKGRELVPYYSREEIEGNSAFNQQPVLYVDDKVALFFLHIQGSGVVEMDDGSRVRLNYEESNGYSYKSIGKDLILDNEIPKEKMSMEAIKDYFQRHPEKIDYYFNKNPSYVFFKEDTGGPYGSTNAVVTPYRSIAADAGYFPKFGLAYIETEIPDGKDEAGNIKTNPFSTLVFDQDSGGAIKGPGRVDIYFGEGDEATFRAGFMNYRGTIYYLKKKK